jgi:hypothetical protein
MKQLDMNTEIKRRRLLEVFKSEQPISKDEDHPELKDGAAEWVRAVRSESEAPTEPRSMT